MEKGVSRRKGTPILIDMQAFLLPTAPKHAVKHNKGVLKDMLDKQYLNELTVNSYVENRIVGSAWEWKNLVIISKNHNFAARNINFIFLKN